MRRLLLLATLLGGILPADFSPSHAQTYEWRILPSAPVAPRNNDVQFLTPELGWVGNNNGQMWKTTDGGDSWVKQLQISGNIRSIHFVDELYGFAGTLSADDLLYRTTDGGDTWTSIDAAVPEPRPRAICGMSGFGDHVFGSGYWFDAAHFIRSTDRGATWVSADLSPWAFNVIDCHFVSPDSGFVVGGRRDPPGSESRSLILFTADAGQTWETRWFGGEQGTFCWKIFFVNDEVGYVSVFGSDPGSGVLKTTDGGMTWEFKSTHDYNFIQGVGFANETHGWADGYGNLSVETTDGGESWTEIVLAQPSAQINRFQMLTETLGYAAGRTIYKYLPGTTAVVEAAPARVTELELSAHPNPFNPTVTLSYRVPRRSRVRVRLYTALGRHIRTLVNGTEGAGAASVVWDGRTDTGEKAASGTYIYRVDAAGTAESNTVTLAR